MLIYFEEPGDANINFPCEICNRNLGINHKAVCSVCHYMIQIKCNMPKISIRKYRF